MATHCAGDIVDGLDSVSADKFIQCDSFSGESNSDISDVQIIEGSKDRRQVEVDKPGSSMLSSNSTYLGTVAKSLLEYLQTTNYKCSELSRKRGLHRSFDDAAVQQNEER